MENQLQSLLLWVGRIAGVGGVLIFAAAIVARLSGVFVVAQFQSGTLMQAGIAAMQLGCLSYVAMLVRQFRGRAQP